MEKEIHRIEEVKLQDDLLLWVRFASGEIKLYDVKPLLTEIEAFSVLQSNSQLLYNVHVALGGYGVLWNEDIDLSSDELWRNGNLVA